MYRGIKVNSLVAYHFTCSAAELPILEGVEMEMKALMSAVIRLRLPYSVQLMELASGSSGWRPGEGVLDQGWPQHAIPCPEAEASTLVCSRRLREVCGDGLMVAAQWRRRISLGLGGG